MDKQCTFEVDKGTGSQKWPVCSFGITYKDSAFDGGGPGLIILKLDPLRLMTCKLIDPRNGIGQLAIL